MMPTSSGVLGALFLLIVGRLPAPAADLVITGRMHHLRSGADREWAEFPAKAEGRELLLAFQAKPNQAEQTLRLRHRDLKEPWRVLLNGKEIARLPFDEADMMTSWAVPAGALKEGRNQL